MRTGTNAATSNIRNYNSALRVGMLLYVHLIDVSSIFRHVKSYLKLQHIPVILPVIPAACDMYNTRNVNAISPTLYV